MYILPATSIKLPLLVVRNFGAESRRNYLHCLPRTKWPGLFTLKIKELMKLSRRRVKKRSRSLDNGDSKRGDSGGSDDEYDSDVDNLTLEQMKAKKGEDDDGSNDEYDSDDDKCTLQQMKAKYG
jgi:hypothetical protein